jgi:hypothetical protein
VLLARLSGTYTITADIDAGKEHGFSNAKDPKGNDVTDVSGTAVDNNTQPLPINSKPKYCSVKTAAVGRTGKGR